MSRSATDSRDLVISRLLSAPAQPVARVGRPGITPNLVVPEALANRGSGLLIFAPAGPFTP
ncbi:glutathione S-transferase-related transmembrane protein [Klebsiella pneumoniae]|uniref:Glutathione S-transferase-related transmembrane protein n=1 Tax=Klebsiella pneumoniae TaxID=573 RepID=A0A378F978_KLEPN|nr:glutathione S-transferase-related transmembrane protein [Klebsiella pneumoniae]